MTKFFPCHCSSFELPIITSTFSHFPFFRSALLLPSKFCLVTLAFFMALASRGYKMAPASFCFVAELKPQQQRGSVSVSWSLFKLKPSFSISSGASETAAPFNSTVESLSRCAGFTFYPHVMNKGVFLWPSPRYGAQSERTVGETSSCST